MLLIINPSKKITRSVSETFYYMGILSYGATPTEGLSEISALYRAVLIISPEDFPDVSDYVKRLKAYKADIPIFAVCGKENSYIFADIFDEVFAKPTFSASLAERIISHANKRKFARIGDYRLAGLDASADFPVPLYFDSKVRLTKTETMILRYLIRSYPLPVNSTNILKYAFRPSRAPESASVRTHISIINKKFEDQAQRRMITLIPHEGYMILTPELVAKGKLL